MLPGATSEEAMQIERLQKELRTVAALEVRKCIPIQSELHHQSVSFRRPLLKPFSSTLPCPAMRVRHMSLRMLFSI